MQLFLQFVVEKWYLTGPWLVLVVLYFANEKRRGGASVSPSQLTMLMNKEQGVVVDLRDSGEFRKAHIVGSMNIPYSGLAGHIDELRDYKDCPIILVCKLGQHSGSAGKQLKAKGFGKVYRLRGGISEWQASQLPLVKG